MVRRLQHQHPGLAPLLHRTRIAVSHALSATDLYCDAPESLLISARLLEPEPDIVSVRFGLELAWLAGLHDLSQAAAAVLAARAAGLFARIVAAAGTSGRLRAVFDRLAQGPIDVGTLDPASLALAATHGGPEHLTERDRRQIHELWHLTAPTEFLLASGGDDRLTLDAGGRNRYGCAPWPLPSVISFGSCTASSISGDAFDAAETARQGLAAAALRRAASAALAEASEAIAADLLCYFRSEDLAEAVLAASGTDATLVVTGLLAAEHPEARLTSILMSPAETGSGVPDAVQGRHFAAFAPTGHSVGKGQPIDGLARGPSLLTVSLRDESGAPRPAGDISADCEAAIRLGVAHGRVVLHAIDGSKTGLTAPDRAECRRLAELYGDRLDIVIDACQARIEPELVRWYLQQGFPILVTGSKFFGAPGFCGAVLFPKARLRRIASHGRLPAGLEPYARLQGGFGSRRCPGLVLRWRAALHEMANFARLPADEVGPRIGRMGDSVCALLARAPGVRLIAAPRPAGMGWSEQRTVFTFAVRSAAGWMTQAELRPVYQALNDDASGDAVAGLEGPLAAQACQIGQPVELGGAALGGLRIALSAAQIVADTDPSPSLAVVLGKFQLILARGSACRPSPPPETRAAGQSIARLLTG
jgi:hypothetical protein